MSYFWPIWPFIGWGLGLCYHRWCVYSPEKPITEDEIRREMKKAA
ncbi:MAG: 2TM domain-containing protein [Roseiarcus sp.]